MRCKSLRSGHQSPILSMVSSPLRRPSWPPCPPIFPHSPTPRHLRTASRNICAEGKCEAKPSAPRCLSGMSSCPPCNPGQPDELDPVAQVQDDPGFRLLPPCPSPPPAIPRPLVMPRQTSLSGRFPDCGSAPGISGAFLMVAAPLTTLAVSSVLSKAGCGSWACRAAVETGTKSLRWRSLRCCWRKAWPWLLAARNSVPSRDSLKAESAGDFPANNRY